MFIDTHAHIYLDKFEEDIDDLLNEARQNGVEKIFMPNIDLNTIDSMENLRSRYPEICYPMIGLHPCSVKEDFRKKLDLMYDILKLNKYYGIGETGIDLYWDKSFIKEQKEAFQIQIDWAKEFELPVIIHSRDSLDLTIEMIQNNQTENLNGIFHCFNGSIDQAKKIIETGFILGLGGVVTFKNAGLNDMVAYLPKDSFVLETDAPYLAPHPYRGKINKPLYIPIIADKIADIRGVSVENVRLQSTINATKLYKINPE